nr:hypothetical protein [Tanacetum cinerariifolium]
MSYVYVILNECVRDLRQNHRLHRQAAAVGPRGQGPGPPGAGSHYSAAGQQDYLHLGRHRGRAAALAHHRVAALAGAEGAGLDTRRNRRP